MNLFIETRNHQQTIILNMFWSLEQICLLLFKGMLWHWFSFYSVWAKNEKTKQKTRQGRARNQPITEHRELVVNYEQIMQLFLKRLNKIT